jgi:hypothetical protein
MNTRKFKMKGALLAFSIFGAGVCSSFAQEQQTNVESGISSKFGIKAGINLANMYTDDVRDENMKLGLNVGFLAKVPLTRGLSIQPELLYSSKGSKLTYDNVLGEGEYRFNLHYVELPVLAVINLARNLNLHVGPYVGFLAGVNITDINNDGTVDEIMELDVDNFNRFDIGLSGGLGLDIQNFTIGARYNYGLGEIGKSGSIPGGLTNNSKNSVISFYIGFGF